MRHKYHLYLKEHGLIFYITYLVLLPVIYTLTFTKSGIIGPTTHYTSQSSQSPNFGLAVKLKELTWMTRNKSGRCGRYGTYKGTIRKFRLYVVCHAAL